MIDEKYINLVTAYLKDSLNAEDRKHLNKLIDQGKIDLQDLKEMERMYERIGTLSIPEPEDALRDRFYALLENEKTRQKKSLSSQPFLKGWILQLGNRLKLRQLGYAVLIFLIGLLAGDLFAPISNRDEQIDRLSSEVYQMREMMMITLLDNTSPTERLKAVNISTEIRSVDNRVVDALIQTLNNDPNINVRIAAVNSLVQHASNPKAREGLVSAIATQESPIVQAALADAMLALQENRAVEEFKKLLEQNGLDQNVRNKLENTIAALS